MKAQDVAKKLNELIEIDKAAVNKLINHRVKFDEKLASSEIKFMVGENLEMGVIGLLNGLIDDEFLIAASCEKNDSGQFEVSQFVVIDARTGD